jgi:hypothetical protein
MDSLRVENEMNMNNIKRQWKKNNSLVEKW